MSREAAPIIFLHSDSAATVLDSVADGVFTVDAEFRVTFFNRAAETITGVPRSEALGQRCWEVFRADICEAFCALRETMDTGEPIVERATTIVGSDGRRIPISISTALLQDGDGNLLGGVETFRDLSLVEQLRKELTAKWTVADIVYHSHAMKEVLSFLPEIAESESTALITGESGTGKELVARALHDLSPRADRPFVAVNCGALPDSLLESELFGHARGAFTGAARTRKGRFALAEGGSIFLDEIGDVSAAMQVRLLRVLQEREYDPVGADASVKTDVRVICATNRNLETMVAEGTFRHDLYYRVNVVAIRLPPLRERKEDIPLLVDHFVSTMNEGRTRPVLGVSNEAMASFMAHDWPGNVRELQNALEHAFILCAGDWIEPRCLPPHLRLESAAPLDTGLRLEEIERRAICDALERNDWRRLDTARELGINKTTLWRKMKAFGIKAPDP